MKIGGHEIELSNRDKVFFEDAGLTKGDVVEHYRKVAPVMLPHLRGRPVSMERFPDGIDGPSFFNKDTPDHFPDWIERVEFPRREGGSFRAPVIESEAALVYLADQAVLTPHLYLAPTDDLEHPDRLVFDLDPPEGTEDFALVRRAALALREVLDDVDLPAWVQTTGSKGYHVTVPLDGSADFDEARDFARELARVVVDRDDEHTTLEQRKKERKGRVFLDTLRNAYGATVVAPYALRARPGAPVATPIDWDELEKGADPRDWTLTSVPRRLGQREDPWKDMRRHARSLGARRERLRSLS